MLKEYKAKSIISIGVKTAKGKVRVNFTPSSFGGSVYVTSNKELQEALESDQRFGVTYKLIRQSGTDEPAPKEEEKVAEAPVEKKEVEVNDISEAKDYLVDNFGYKKNKLRSLVSIKTAADDNNIIFIGI